MRRLSIAVAVAVGLALVAGASAAPSGAIGPFAETFSGQPSSPQPWTPADWDVTVHSHDESTRYELESMAANHGHDCAGPPATHTVSSYADAVFLCRDHVMTSINTSAYGLIYLTPPQLVDFSSGEAVVRFDMSTLRTSERDWVDIWISPYTDEVQLALQSHYPDLNGPPRRAIHVFMSTFDGKTNFKAEVYRGFNSTDLVSDEALVYDDFLTPDAARRDTFELRISDSKIVFGMPTYNKWWVDTNHGGLDWNRGVVQFGHHSYTPTKDCSACTPNTWHWDNISINPAVPFTILRANRRYVDPSTPPSVSFPKAAGANASLRFAGMGDNIEVSFDGGSTWRAAQLQAQEKAAPGEHATSYRTPVPAGATSARFRADDWWGGEWIVRDISIWSLSAAGAATPPPTVAPPAAVPANEPEPEPEPPAPGDEEASDERAEAPAPAPHDAGAHGAAASGATAASGVDAPAATSTTIATAASTTADDHDHGDDDEVTAPAPLAADVCVAGACDEESGGSSSALAWVLAAAAAFVGLGGAGLAHRRSTHRAAVAAAAAAAPPEEPAS